MNKKITSFLVFILILQMSFGPAMAQSSQTQDVQQIQKCMNETFDNMQTSMSGFAGTKLLLTMPERLKMMKDIVFAIVYVATSVPVQIMGSYAIVAAPGPLQSMKGKLNRLERARKIFQDRVSGNVPEALTAEEIEASALKLESFESGIKLAKFRVGAFQVALAVLIVAAVYRGFMALHADYSLGGIDLSMTNFFNSNSELEMTQALASNNKSVVDARKKLLDFCKSDRSVSKFTTDYKVMANATDEQIKATWQAMENNKE